MPQVQLNIALSLDTEIERDRALLDRLLAPEIAGPIGEKLINGTAQAGPPVAPPAPKPTARKAPVKTSVTDVLGPDPGNGADTGDDMGLDPDAASMSPTEARDAGLAVVREIYAANHVAEVKALQKKWNVSKFYDVPETKGHEFYAETLKIAQSVGLRP